MTADDRAFRASAPWLWAALTLVALAVAFIGAFGAAAMAASWGLGRTEGALGLRLDLALFLLLTGILGTLSILVAARMVFGRWLHVTGDLLVFPVIGMVIAPALELTLHEWARVHIGYYYGWDFVGWTAGLSFLVVLCSLAIFGVLVAPRGAVAPPLAGVGLAATLVCLIVVSNVPGLRDGIDPESWPLAIGVGLSAMYVIGCVVVGVRKATAG